MAKQLSIGTGLLRAMISLVFLSGLATAALSSQVATDNPQNKSFQAPAKAVVIGPILQGDALNSRDSMLSPRVEISPSEDFGLAFEDNDSIQIFRIGLRRCAVGLEREVVRLTISPPVAQNLRPTISPPLLV
jgi:hypothetical protein